MRDIKTLKNRENYVWNKTVRDFQSSSLRDFGIVGIYMNVEIKNKITKKKKLDKVKYYTMLLPISIKAI